MGPMIFSVLTLYASSMLARILIGGGLVLVVSAGLSALLEGLLSDAASNIGGMPSTAFQLLMLGGVGDAISILGSALLTRAAINAAGRILGVKLAQGG